MSPASLLGMPYMNRIATRVVVAVVLTAGSTVAACGDDSDGDTSATTVATASTTTSAPAPTQPAGTQPATTSPSTDAPTATVPVSSTAPGATTRVVDTPAGPVEVPVSPQRVVLVDYYSLPDMLEVGVTPVGAPDQLEDGLTADQLAIYDSIAKVGQVSELNFEAIAGLEPDLIIGVDSYNGDDYETLSAIAPTVLIPFASSGDWPALAHQVADLVGKSAEMDALQHTYEDASAAIAADHADALASTRWDIVSGGTSAKGAGTTYVWLANSTTGSIMADAGFRLGSASAATSENGFTEVSYEQLGVLQDATALVTLAGADGAIAPSSADLVDQPLFQALPAAQNGNVFPVIQMFPASFGQATLLLSELEAALGQLA